MGRRLLPAVLAAIAVGFGVLAFTQTRAPDALAGHPPPSAPVLTPARTPEFLAGLVADGRLDDALDAVLSDPGLVPARDRTCLVVHDDRGRSVYARRPDLPLIPASNLKLLTATVALDRLGPRTTFHTDLRARQAPAGGVVAGDVWIVGGGDPLLATADYASQAGYQHQPRPSTPLEALADRVAAAGVRQVQGRVVADETRYDTQRSVPSWSPRYLADGEIGPVSALTVNDGFVSWQPRAVPAPSPATAAANVLVGLFRARGVTVTGGAAEGHAPPDTRPLAGVDSAPLTGVVEEMLRQSDNQAAEVLLKEVGYRVSNAGTTAAGLAVVRDRLSGLGFPVDQLQAVDGSGLDRGDRASCGLLLRAVERGGPRGDVAAGLPRAGQDGTLLHRYGGSVLAGRLRAKTGSLEGVAAFTGWLDLDRGRSLAFSLVANGVTGEAAGTALEDRLATTLASYPQGPPPGELAPR